MRTAIIIVLVITGAIFVGSVMLMTPKWWLGAGIAGIWGSNEYGSKKSVESTLKKIAVITAIIFTLCVIFLPYVK